MRDMTTSTPARPRPTAASPPAPPGPAGDARPRATPRRERGGRRAWIVALSISAGFHLLVLLFSPLFIRVGAPPGEDGAAPDSFAQQAIQMIDPALIPSVSPPAAPTGAEPEAPAAMPTDAVRTEPARTVERDLPSRTVPRAAQPGTGGESVAPGDNPLRPGLRDPRLWVPSRELPPEREPTQEELHARYMAQLEARIDRWNDSVAGETDRARRATDWTVRDKDGGRWGISPDGIHLGGVTLPPMTFPPGGGDPDKRARWEEQERARREIDRQQADTERRRVREERARATRQRKDAERPGGT